MKLDRLITPFKPATPQIDPTPQVGGMAPWGTIQTITYHATGITFCETMGHGGFHLAPDLLEQVPADWRMARHGLNASLENPWFEEDVDWCFVALTFRDKFSPGAIKAAQELFDFFKAAKLGGRA